jgi:type VI secretion system protein VasD
MFGCSSKKSTVGGYLNLDTDVKIDFIVDSDINPDDLGNASPLFVRMYELKSTTLMQKADFLDIYENDKKVLGADLIKAHKLKRFAPGENRSEKFVLDEKTGYVALYGEFNNFSNAKFKLIFPVVANNVFRNNVTVQISGDSLILVE